MKAKKVLAMLMASAMIMGTSVTAFAAEQTTITVQNENEEASKASIRALQVIGADQTKVTGWTFLNGTGSCFTEAFGAADEQQAIWQLIVYQYKNDNKIETNVADLPDYVQEYSEITAGQIDAALSKVLNTKSGLFEAKSNPFNVSSAGVYAINASQTGYTYKMMAAYVGFTGEEGVDYPTLEENVTLTEKGAPTTITKTGKDDDAEANKDNDYNDNNNIVAIGDTVTYTIKMDIPYVDPKHFEAAELPEFYITDEIDGATYIDSSFKVKIGGSDVEGSQYVVEDETPVSGGDEAFSIDFSDWLNADNSNAGKEVEITYQATITEVTTDNTAKGHIPDVENPVDDSKEFYTGQITVTKKGEGEDVTLPGAGFEVTNSKDETLTFRAAAYTLNEGEQLPVAGAYIYDPDGEITEIFTGADGTLVVEGLDVGQYHFEETTAPAGYSINEEGEDVTITNTDGDKVSKVIKVTGELEDTKLSSLPSTGGIGTTIFTIGGCAIMVTAAGLYFATRKKTEK